MLEWLDKETLGIILGFIGTVSAGYWKASADRRKGEQALLDNIEKKEQIAKQEDAKKEADMAKRWLEEINRLDEAYKQTQSAHDQCHSDLAELRLKCTDLEIAVKKLQAAV